jgi:enoyl-CoA hydratase
VAELLALGREAPSVSPGQAAVGVGVAAALDLVPGLSDALTRTPAAALVTLRRFHDTLSGMGRSGAVWIAALNGSAMGGGCELALACDLRIMADGPFALGQPEILLGFPPGGGATQRLARLIGRGRALELVLEGRPVEPAEAERIGLVNRLVAPERLREEALATAERLARRPREAVALTKRAVLEGGSLALDAGLRMENAAFMATLGSAGARKAMEAYLAEQERLGDVPAYDEATRERLRDGTLVDFSER